MLNNYYMAPCSGRAKGARLTHFKGYWLVVFYHSICGNRQRAPCNGRAFTSRQGWCSNQLGFESPAFH
nr:MAG TPA: hypothetical protein [Caudoviricetes sp.]